MLLVLLSLFLALSAFPIDFDSQTGRDPTDGYWLEPASYTADISTTVLTSSYIEFTFLTENAGHRCVYSIWYNGARVQNGNFRNAVPTVIPVLAGSIDNSVAGDHQLTVMTTGCYVGRYANTFVLGDNDGSLYVYDWSPGNQPAAPTNTDKGVYTIDSFGSYQAFTSQWVADGLGRISSQTNDRDPSAIGWWYALGDGGGIARSIIDWNGLLPATHAFVIDMNYWQVVNNLVSSSIRFEVCNASNCQDTTDLLVDYDQQVIQSYEREIFAPNRDSISSFIQTYYLVDPNGDFDSSLDTKLAVSWLTGGALVPPYVKLWDIDSSQYSNPNQFMIDLRSLTSPSCPKFWDIPSTNNAEFRDFSSYGSWTSNSDPSYTPADNTYIRCPNNVANQLTAPVLTSCQALATIGTSVVTSGSISIGGFDMPNGAYVQVPLYDPGIPNINTGICADFGPAITQLSSFNLVNGADQIGPFQARVISSGGVGRSSAHGIYSSAHLGNPSSLTIQFASTQGFSIGLFPFMTVYGFAPDVCNASQCVPPSTCSNPRGSTDCTIDTVPGGFEGDGSPTPFCTLATCFNSGTCVENTARTFDAELHGTGGLVNTTSCDCSSSQGVTGPYWGEFCQYPPPCDSNPCLNGGACVNLVDSDYSCNCVNTTSPFTSPAVPYSGPRCEISGTTPCDYNPCLNGGACTNDATAPGGFSCNCIDNWLGHRCGQPPVDACTGLAATDPCGQFGKCVPSTNPATSFYTCVCVFGYSGPTCSARPAICDRDWTLFQGAHDREYCQNNGLCISVPKEFTDSDPLAANAAIACLCADPWVGSRCQFNSTLFAGASSNGISLIAALLLLILTFTF